MVSIRIDEDLWAQVGARAAAEQTSKTAYVSKVLASKLSRGGVVEAVKVPVVAPAPTMKPQVEPEPRFECPACGVKTFAGGRCERGHGPRAMRAISHQLPE